MSESPSQDATIGSRPGPTRRPLTDWLVPAIIFVFCGVVAALTTTFKKAPDIIVGDAMQPRNFPLFLVLLVAIFNVILIWQMLNSEPKARPRQPWQTFATALLMILFYPGVMYVDMFLSMAVIMFGMCLVWGERRIWVAALVSVVTCAVIFFSFDQLLQIRFPRGILTNLWYG